MRANYKLWPCWPYAGETRPPIDPVEIHAGSWTMSYLRMDRSGNFTDLCSNDITLNIENPNNIDWDRQLDKVIRTAKNLTSRQIRIARYWGAGNPTKQWTPIIDRLIDTYDLSPPRAARVLAAVQSGINDSMMVCWHLKYKWQVARPIQYDPDFASILCTPRFPAYPSGHSVMSGCAEIILSYFFPPERHRLKELAEECAVSREYAGVHFPADDDEGLRLGRQIGCLVVNVLKNQRNARNEPIDVPILQDRCADMQPPPYRQAMPFEFSQKCQSNVRDEPSAKCP